MKRFLMILTLIAGIGLSANAQITQKSPEQRASHMTRVLQRRLNLTPAQAFQINSVLFNKATRMDSLKSNLSTDKKANQLARKSIALSAKKQVTSVLNDDQKLRFIEFQKAARERHRQKGQQTGDLQG